MGVFGSKERKMSGWKREWNDALSIVWHTLIKAKERKILVGPT